ncbi:hypothetical protein BASA60_003798 [Batrachochytrium salamandrivorans]|nr:hypothetical protein BASA60_003798 [Batrachochytrium salamandrivorans]
MNDLTYDIFVVNKNPNVNLHARAWKETEPGSHFTNVFFLHSTESVNTLGQVYLRPMGVFNDAMCYSSCELFSGNIQGHGVGTIFGEDEQTGGGGAIAKKLDPSLLRFGFEDFRKFPFTQELTSGSKTHANTLSVGVTQVVRTGLYKGQIIEDYDRIAASLARTGQENGQSKLHFVCEPFLIEKPINGFSLEVETAGIERFTVFQADGKTIIAKKRRRSATNKQKFAIPVSADAITLGNSQIIIVGKTAGVQVLKTKRNVRIIPDDDKYMEISTSGFTFTGTSDSVGLYQSPATAPGNGWNNLKGPWMIGNGVQYVENIDSSIEAFFSAPVGTNINIGIDVALDSMPGHDFLYLYVKSSDGVEDFLLRSKNRDGAETLNGVSGLDMIIKETFPFTTKSEKFSVSLKFISNRSREFAGATINLFTVSAA